MARFLCWVQNPARWRNLGTVLPGSLSRAAVDVYFINREDPALQRQAARIRQFVAAGGGLVIAFQVRWGTPLAAWSALDKVSLPWHLHQDPRSEPNAMSWKTSTLACGYNVCC